MTRFAFEDDTYATLDFMPYAARYRLDRAGVKLSLAAWQALPLAERAALCAHPVDADDDRASLRARCLQLGERVGHPAKELAPAPDPPPWRALDAFTRVAARFEALGRGLPRVRWEALDDEAAYTLWRLADPAKDDGRFAALAREVGLA